jgi:uncharacterized glyoxalase superfamily protein PhnB
MKLDSLVPVLWVGDIELTIAFDRDVLDFDCPDRMDKLGFTGSLYFRPDNIDRLWERVKDRVPVVYPIENFSYGMREFAIRDNNGYILQFGKPLNHP